MVAAPVLHVGGAEKFDTKRAQFTLVFNGESSAYREMSTFVLPEAPLTIEVAGGPDGTYTLKTEQGAFVARGSRAWRWTAPAAEKLTFKLLLNDSVWAQGSDLVAGPGEKVEVVPAF